ncbi:MAG TPA: prenyltransferase, partial [Acidimicrobiia bacterium]|nr:prenyltransferase [Acidimicrobiia bacterium]
MPAHHIPAVEGILTADQISATVDAIAAIQLPDGNIPWTPGDHTDPWNLVEAAMALDIGGRHLEATRAYEWLRSMQHDAGCWHAYYVGNEVKDHALDTNVTCYVA